jgi:hypothetical protein
MKKITYINRYADCITFTQEGDTIVMEGYEGDYLRIATKDGRVVMIDPSGGPCLDVGDDLVEFFKDGVPRVIESIEVKQGFVIFKIEH